MLFTKTKYYPKKEKKNQWLLCTDEVLDSNSIIMRGQLSFPVTVCLLISHRLNKSNLLREPCVQGSRSNL